MNDSSSNGKEPASETPLSAQFPIASASFGRSGPRTAPIGAAIFAAVSALFYLYEDLSSSLGLYLILAVAVGGVVLVLGEPSVSHRENQSAHPDPDVRALIEERIDISEYRRRKEAASLRPRDSERGDA